MKTGFINFGMFSSGIAGIFAAITLDSFFTSIGFLISTAVFIFWKIRREQQEFRHREELHKTIIEKQKSQG